MTERESQYPFEKIWLMFEKFKFIYLSTFYSFSNFPSNIIIFIFSIPLEITYKKCYYNYTKGKHPLQRWMLPSLGFVCPYGRRLSCGPDRIGIFIFACSSSKSFSLYRERQATQWANSPLMYSGKPV